MLKKIQLLLKMNKEEPLVTTCYFIMLFFLAFTLNYTLASIEGSKYSVNLLKNYNGGILFFPFFPQNLEVGEHYEYPYLDDMASESDIDSLGITFECEAVAKNNVNLKCLQYSKGLLDTAEFKLSQGRWFQNENEIVLIHSARKVFDLNEKISIKYYDQPIREVTVVGFLSNDIIVNAIGGKVLGSDGSIGYNYESLTYDDYWFVAEQDVFTAIVSPSLNLESFYIRGLQFIKLKPDVSKEKALLYLQEKYKEYGDFVDFDPNYDVYKKDVFEMINRDEVFLLACLLVLFCAGFCINNALRISKKKTEYSIYYMCGLTWSQSVIMTYLKSLLIFIVAIPMGTAYLYLNIKSGSFLNLILTKANIFLVFGGLVMVYILFSLPIYLKFRRQDPIMLLRKENL